MKDKNTNKKRLLYDVNEDLYFFTYNILLILNNLECDNEENTFKDYRKLVFLIQFLSSEINTRILIDYYRGKIKINKNIRSILNDIYINGIEKIQFIRYVLLILEKHNLIRLVNEENSINLYLLDKGKQNGFLEGEIFKKDIQNILNIKKSIGIIKKVKYSTFINNIFKENEVKVWEE